MQKNIVSVMLALFVACSLEGQQERGISPVSSPEESCKREKIMYDIECEVESNLVVFSIINQKNAKKSIIKLDLLGDGKQGMIDNKPLTIQANNNLLSLFSIDKNWKKESFFYKNKATITSSYRNKVFMIANAPEELENSSKIRIRKPIVRKLDFGDAQVQSVLPASNNFSLNFDETI